MLCFRQGRFNKSNCGVVGLESERAGRWSFEEGAGVADDSSENENDATIHGAS